MIGSVRRFDFKPESSYKIPVITYSKDESKRRFTFGQFPGIHIQSGIYNEQQAQLDAAKELLNIQLKLIVDGCLNKECPVCKEVLAVDIKNFVEIFNCKHAVHVDCVGKSK